MLCKNLKLMTMLDNSHRHVLICDYNTIFVPYKAPLKNLITWVDKPQKYNLLLSTKLAKLGIIRRVAVC